MSSSLQSERCRVDPSGLDAEWTAFLAEAPLFHQPWWLEAVAPGAWSYATVRRSGQLMAIMPLVHTPRLLQQGWVVMPLLTQTLGPWLRLSATNYTRQLEEQKDVMTALIDALPPFALFLQNFHHSVTNWLPFYWRGFTQTTRYTYLLPDLSDEQSLWDGMRGNVRTDIRKAKQQLTLTDSVGLDDFLQLNAQTFTRQGARPAYSESYVRRIDAACAAHDARRILGAVDDQGRLHAVVYLAWTPQTAYYLMGGADPALRSSGATSLVLWEAIRFARGVAQTFDFEGSMIEGVERFFRAFGARQTPYSVITCDRRHAAQRTVDAVRTTGGRLLRSCRLKTVAATQGHAPLP